MNDWSNDTLAPGDLVHVYNRPVVPQWGIVISLDKPPRGSLQVYDAQVLIEGKVVNVYRHDMYRITDDSPTPHSASGTPHSAPGTPHSTRAHK
jgi:hypothetical protein